MRRMLDEMVDWLKAMLLVIYVLISIGMVSFARAAPIAPTGISPRAVLHFGLNLMATSQVARRWTIDPTVKGLVFWSGYEDTYVDAAATRRVLRANTKFEVISYPGALHELDNEIEDVRRDLIPRTISFLNSVR